MPWRAEIHETSRLGKAISGLGVVRAFSAGSGATCAVTEAGSAQCWGDNVYGKLGDGTQTRRMSPVQVVGLESGVTQISISGDFACAVTEQGGAKCWGGNNHGVLGNGSTENSLAVVDVVGLDSGVALIRAAGHQTCVLTVTGDVKCWGYDEMGAVGTKYVGNQLTPFQVPGLSKVSELSSYSASNCVVVGTPAAIKCWGADGDGELGDGGGGSERTPKIVPGF